MTEQKENKSENKTVAIALQGGGAHGAFAWGILDKLLEEPRLDIVGVSGTSAGAMNAASLVQGLTHGGRKGAQNTLNRYWGSLKKVSGPTTPYQPTLFDKLSKYHNLDHSPSFLFMESMQNFLSPYEFNPFDMNPFYDFLKDFFDYETLAQSPIGLYLATTEVQTGKIKIWNNHEVSADVLMASACLPFLYQAVKIDGKYYWDGGYIANPAIFPLINSGKTQDIVVIQLRRLKCHKVPTTRMEINDRLKEITFNGCLVREMRAIKLLTQLIDNGTIKEGAMTRFNLHIIRNEESFDRLNMSSALNTDETFLKFLHEEGYKTAEVWLRDHFDEIGTKVPVDSDGTFSDFM
ncbi:MAG: patatin-like phospholipase family protein [Holosporales bacterium]|jgi:NTE family protein|nr:patatin-like phospholipase family protein [Holosporales bacterium]